MSSVCCRHEKKEASWVGMGKSADEAAAAGKNHLFVGFPSRRHPHHCWREKGWENDKLLLNESLLLSPSSLERPSTLFIVLSREFAKRRTEEEKEKRKKSWSFHRIVWVVHSLSVFSSRSFLSPNKSFMIPQQSHSVTRWWFSYSELKGKAPELFIYLAMLCHCVGSTRREKREENIQRTLKFLARIVCAFFLRCCCLSSFCLPYSSSTAVINKMILDGDGAARAFSTPTRLLGRKLCLYSQNLSGKAEWRGRCAKRARGGRGERKAFRCIKFSARRKEEQWNNDEREEKVNANQFQFQPPSPSLLCCSNFVLSCQCSNDDTIRSSW